MILFLGWKLKGRVSVSIYIILACMLALTDIAHGSEITIKVRDDSRIASTNVTLSDIAEISGEDADEVKRLKSIGITNFPQRARTKSLSKGMVISILKRKGIDLDAIDFESPAVVRLSRKMMAVKIGEIKASARKYLEQYLERRPEDVVITGITCKRGDLSLPQGMLEVEFLPLNRAILTGSMPLYANLFVNGTMAERVDMRAGLEMSQEIAVAAHTIKKGDVLSEDDFTMEKRVIKKSNSAFVTDPAQIIGKRATRRLSLNHAILENMVDQPPLIKKKDRVRIVLESRFIKVTTVGVAYESGVRGSYIKVMNLDSRKIILAKVIGENLVKVGF